MDHFQSTILKVPAQISAKDVKVSLPVSSYIGEETFDPEATCFACKNVLWNPELCGACATIFCHSCTRAKCPACKQQYAPTACPKMVTNYLRRAKFQCNQCPVVFAYSDSAEHQLSHLNQRIKCPLGCDKESSHSEISSHLFSSCPAVNTNCVRCESSVPRGD